MHRLFYSHFLWFNTLLLWQAAHRKLFSLYKSLIFQLVLGTTKLVEKKLKYFSSCDDNYYKGDA